MFNPKASDDNHEWIEVFNNGSETDISDLRLYEDDVNHRLTLIQGENIIALNDFFIIADDTEEFLLDYPDYNKTLFDSSFSLSNSGELLQLVNSSHTLDSVFYNNSGIEEGKSLSYFNGSWFESLDIGGTPGEENTIQQEYKNKGLRVSVYLDDEIYLGMSYTKLFKIENLDHISGITDHINVTIGYNISDIKQDIFFIEDLNSYVTANTGEFIPSSDGYYTICGWIIDSTVEDNNKNDDIDCKEIMVIDTTTLPCNTTIDILTEKIIYENGESIQFYNIINNETYPYVIEYWIEDLFGNIVKNKYNTTNTNQKSFTTTIKEKEMVCIIKNQLYPLCDDFSIEDNSAEKLVIIKGEEPKKDCSIEIEDIDLGSDNIVKFGESFQVRLNIYKGDETKNQLLAWVEDNGEKITTKTTKAMLYDAFTEYILTIPLQLIPNCNDKYSDKTYKVVVEAFDLHKEENIRIEGTDSSLCSTKASSSSDDDSKESEFLYSIFSMPEKILSDYEFPVEVEIKNNDNKLHEIEIWSYVYSGSKCYSSGREDNKKFVEIPQKSSIVIELKNKAINTEPGTYKLKVKIRKDNQITEKEITRTIEVIEAIKDTREIKDEALVQFLQSNPEINDLNITAEKNIFYFEPNMENIIYEGTNYKVKELIPYFIIMLLGGLALYLIFKKA